MATYEEFYQALYRVSKGPRYEFWHADSLLFNDQDNYYEMIWRACYTWEEKTCESIMKGLGKTPFIWGLRNQTRKYILDRLPAKDKKIYSETVPLPYLHGTCPENAERYELNLLFKSLLEVAECAYGRFSDSPKKEKEYEGDLVTMYHWLFPYCSMAIQIRDTLRLKARLKFKEMTGEEYGDVLPHSWLIEEYKIPYEKRKQFSTQASCI